MSEPLPILRRWLDEHAIRLDDGATAQLTQYLHLLLEANSVMNLTRISDPDAAQIRLLADSLDLLRVIPDDARTLVDIGSGGGVPGLPLA
ncbi:MAG TPA: 16S rRNA (guanine(527)-N(7))-methyltransferase RsmG, partial [Chloroflexi bacterium]|nr:16S rRNA (guanine(527)-N(7))-methyltransferase RsmG [Chloroflexota bacterium]